MGASLSKCKQCFPSFSQCTECFVGKPTTHYEPLNVSTELQSIYSESPKDQIPSSPSPTIEQPMSGFNSAELRGLCDEATERFFALYDSLDESRFSLSYDKEGCRVMTCDTERSFMIWVVFEIQCSADVFVDFLKQVERRVDVDTNLKAAKVIHRIDDDALVSHLTYKGVLSVSARDLIVLSCYRKFKGAMCEVSQSVRSPEYPETSACIRATLHIGGFHIQPIDDNSCRVTSISETDLGGSLPKMVVKKMAALAFPNLVKNVRTAISRITS